MKTFGRRESCRMRSGSLVAVASLMMCVSSTTSIGRATPPGTPVVVPAPSPLPDRDPNLDYTEYPPGTWTPGDYWFLPGFIPVGPKYASTPIHYTEVLLCTRAYHEAQLPRGNRQSFYRIAIEGPGYSIDVKTNPLKNNRDPVVTYTACTSSPRPCGETPPPCEPGQYQMSRSMKYSWKAGFKIKLDAGVEFAESLVRALGLSVELQGELSNEVTTEVRASQPIEREPCSTVRAWGTWSTESVRGTLREWSARWIWKFGDLPQPTYTHCDLEVTTGSAERDLSYAFDQEIGEVTCPLATCCKCTGLIP